MMIRETAIKNSISLDWPRVLTASALTALLFLAIVLVASNASGQTTPAATSRGKTFATPQEAANSLIDAAEKYDERWGQRNFRKKERRHDKGRQTT
jgi:hypothetical protein